MSDNEYDGDSPRFVLHNEQRPPEIDIRALTCVTDDDHAAIHEPGNKDAVIYGDKRAFFHLEEMR